MPKAGVAPASFPLSADALLLSYFGMYGASVMESNHPRAFWIVILYEHAFARPASLA